MNKKLGMMMLAMMLALCLTATAFASAPSKTTSDLVNTGKTQSTQEETVVPEDLVATVPDTPQVTALKEKLLALVTDDGEPVTNYFSDAVKAEIARKLPAGVSLESLQLNEIVTLAAMAYDPAYGDVVTTFEFPTQYEDGEPIVALLCIFDAAGNEEWIVLEAEAKDGKVNITFTQEALEKMQNTNAALAILSEE